MTDTLTRGDIARCSTCGRARRIETTVIETLGSRVGFGPGGERDMFMQHIESGRITCYWCTADDPPSARLEAGE